MRLTSGLKKQVNSNQASKLGQDVFDGVYQVNSIELVHVLIVVVVSAMFPLPGLGRCHRELGNTDDAMAAFEQRLKMAQALRDVIAEVECYADLGQVRVSPEDDALGR